MLGGLTDLIGQLGQLGDDPLLEAGEVRVTLWQVAVVLKQRTEVLTRLPRHAIEPLVGHRDRPVAEPTQKCLDLEGALPDDDRLWSVRGAERLDQAEQFGPVGRGADETCEVVAQGAAGAKLATVVAGFLAAAGAVEVAADARAWAAYR